MSLVLRPYQDAAIVAVREAWCAGLRRVLLVLATGLGKTICFVEIARRTVERGKRVLILAHRKELLEQAERKLIAAGITPGIEQAERHAGDAMVVLGSMQTLRGARLASWAPDTFALVVIDEAHRSVADGYRAIIEHFASAHLLGVTATPDRLDRKAMAEIYQSCAYRYDMREGIRDGYLAPLTCRRVVLESVNLDGIKTVAGDLSQEEVSDAMTTQAALVGTVRPLLELAGDRRTIVFAATRKHAGALLDLVNGYRPGAARAVDGEKADCLLLDFVGNSGRHKLVGPVDVLAPPDIGDDQRAAIDELLEREGMTVDEAIESLDDAKAARARAREAAKRKAVVDYIAREVDPFRGDRRGRERSGAWTAEPASPKQISILHTHGFRDLPEGLTKGDASAMIDAIDDRRERGLCTIKQARKLRENGIDATTMTFAEARERLDRMFGRYHTIEAH